MYSATSKKCYDPAPQSSRELLKVQVFGGLADARLLVIRGHYEAS
jgi:hypothetical protein